jgi:hypothetical protein
VETLSKNLGTERFTECEAVAYHGEGVFNTLKAITNSVILQVQRSLA